jgi:hypothetical protein
MRGGRYIVKVGKHPNALVAGGSGIGGGALVVWLLGLGGVDMTPEVGAMIAGGIASAALLVGRKGIRGIARAVWRGTDGG